MNQQLCQCESIKTDEIIEDQGNPLKEWLEKQALKCIGQTENKCYLLAHADDGVIWGRFKTDGTLITQTEPEDLFPRFKFAKLRLNTLQQCRIFSKKAEILLWKVDHEWKARLVKDNGLDGEYVLPEEHQILWGTHGEKLENKNFTLLWDGQQGLMHVVPFTDIELDNNQKLKHPVRLTVRHYIDYDESGIAKIYLSRLVDLTAKEIKK